jgi:hypothetical protein
MAVQCVSTCRYRSTHGVELAAPSIALTSF